MPEHAPFVALLVEFARALRSAGLAVGTGDEMTYCAAVASLDPTDLVDLYWAGRTSLVTRREHIAVYDRVFRSFFLALDGPAGDLLTLEPRVAGHTVATLIVPATDQDGERDGEQAPLGLMASDAEALRHKSFAACTPEELAALRRIMDRIRLTPPRRRTRRTRAALSGHNTPDLRRTVRESLRMLGEPAELYWRQRRLRLRPLILILDISGSMSDYSRHLLQFAYTAKRAATGGAPRATRTPRAIRAAGAPRAAARPTGPAKVEVFCFGTRLTRITGLLRTRTPDTALEQAARAVLDWEGGTRIGDSLDAFVKNWGRRGLCRGGVVVICSDGLDRGDPQILSAAMERLSRQCYRLVWMNPHRGDDPNFRPSTLGMMVAAPHVDLIRSGHDLNSLEELAALLPTLG